MTTPTADHPSIQRLSQIMAESLGAMVTGNPFFTTLASTRDRRLFALYLVEVFHFTRHNPVNQAMVVTSCLDWDIETGARIRYMRYCLRHAEEELGHEYMALKDLKSMGAALDDRSLPTPLAETRAFVAYVNEVATKGHPLARLGYSFWAEKCYEFFRPMVTSAVGNMALTDRNLSFFVAHSGIDAEHAADVEKIIVDTVRHDSDVDAIAEVLRGTARLTGRILQAVHERYARIVAGREPGFEWLAAVQG